MRNNVVVFATDLAVGMGYKNALPWPHCKEDLASFKELTAGKLLLMGRKTFESMEEAGVVWGDRRLVILTRDPGSYHSTPEIVYISAKHVNELLGGKLPVYVVGGASILNVEELWETVETVYHTIFKSVYPCDTYFQPEGLDYLENNFERETTVDLTPNCSRIKRKRL